MHCVLFSVHSKCSTIVLHEIPEKADYSKCGYLYTEEENGKSFEENVWEKEVRDENNDYSMRDKERGIYLV